MGDTATGWPRLAGVGDGFVSVLKCDLLLHQPDLKVSPTKLMVEDVG